MNNSGVELFFQQVKIALKDNFTRYSIKILFQTEKSFKANIYLTEKIFIAVRYNARNGRTDFALIKNNRRIAGYDNLKSWHYHPVNDPDSHTDCQEPSIARIITELKNAYDSTLFQE